MSLILRDDLSVSISERTAEELGLHRGSPVRWDRTADGGYALRAGLTREEAARKMHGVLAHFLKPVESAVADLIREREEDAIREEKT